MSELFIETHGHGPRHLVLLHGWAMHGGVFAPLVEALHDCCTLHEGLELLDHIDLRARVADLTQPSTWIAGARDRLVPWAAMDWSARQCGGAFTRIEHAGHAAFLGFADAVVAALKPLRVDMTS